jgi:hypothetical protein
VTLQEHSVVISELLIPEAARYVEWVYGRSLVAIVGSNPAGAKDVCLLRVLYALSDNCLCEGSITPREESYRM